MYGPQFDTVELDVLSAFENIFDIALVQLIVDETTDMLSRKYRKVSNLLVDEIYVVLALVMSMGIVQKPTLGLYYPKDRLLFTLFFLRPNLQKD
jgi:hypothetical protein